MSTDVSEESTTFIISVEESQTRNLQEAGSKQNL
jgi:hypothetical protein